MPLGIQAGLGLARQQRAEPICHMGPGGHGGQPVKPGATGFVLRLVQHYWHLNARCSHARQ